MMIGGVTCELRAPDAQVAYEGVIAVFRQRWRRGVFLDGDGDAPVALRDFSLSWLPPGREFFLFADKDVAATWADCGPCDENWNRMLHFIIDGGDDGGDALVTVVADQRTTEVDAMLGDIQVTYNELARLRDYSEAA